MGGRPHLLVGALLGGGGLGGLLLQSLFHGGGPSGGPGVAPQLVIVSET